MINLRPAHILILLALIAGVSANAASYVTNSEANIRKAGDTHTLSLTCAVENNRIRMSRVTVLASTLSDRYEIGITTGHSFIDSEGNLQDDCLVRDFHGHEYEVKAVKVAEDYVPGTRTDWAIIAFERARKTPVVRYKFAKPLDAPAFDRFGEERLPVMFSSARGLPDAAQACTFLPRNKAGFTRDFHDGLLPHTCQAIGGQSGAPVSVARGDEDIVLGIHIGHAFYLPAESSEKPRWLGYIRIFDETMRRQVNYAILEFTAEDAR